jgi:calcium permeable stress-gated cation channel
LEKLWINRESTSDDDDTPSPEIVHEESVASSVSLGDTHVWRENGDDNV